MFSTMSAWLQLYLTVCNHVGPIKVIVSWLKFTTMNSRNSVKWVALPCEKLRAFTLRQDRSRFQKELSEDFDDLFGSFKKILEGPFSDRFFRFFECICKSSAKSSVDWREAYLIARPNRSLVNKFSNFRLPGNMMGLCWGFCGWIMCIHNEHWGFQRKSFERYFPFRTVIHSYSSD